MMMSYGLITAIGQKSHGNPCKNGKRLRFVNGTYPKNQWMSINWRWYYFDENGYMVTGWIQQNGKWYYCDSSGAMVIGERMIGNERFYFAEDGHMCVTNERGALV